MQKKNPRPLSALETVLIFTGTALVIMIWAALWVWGNIETTPPRY